MPCLAIDASVAAWCFKGEATPVSGPAEEVAPRLLAYELRITSKMAREFLQSLQGLRIRMTEPASYDDIFQLAERTGLTVYDASYLELALCEGLPLASLDVALLPAALASGVAVFQP